MTLALDPAGATFPAALLAIAAATLVSEDATCVAVGLLVAEGRIGFVAGSLACFLGIYVGDLLLFAAGRFVGRAALTRWPLSRLASAEAIDRSSAWLERRGAWVVALSRVIPGTRLPTYLAAGLLRTRAVAFAAYFLVAAAVWTPLVVGVSAWTSGRALLLSRNGGTLAAIALTAGALLVAVRTIPPLFTRRGRRLALGRWRRLRRWEYWPLPVFYVPIVLHIARLAIKYRSLTLPTAVNPAIPGGGFAGESKIDILRGLGSSGDAALAATLVSAAEPLAGRIERAERFIAENRLRFPVVLKPDVGERGSGVHFPRDAAELVAALGRMSGDLILQEHAPGLEFGIFYVRRPDEERGRIFSITEKVLPVLRGDGRRTLEELILDDDRAVCMARLHLARFADRLHEVPAQGGEIRLVEVGTHSRGAIFLDGESERTPALEDAIEAIARGCDGFYFGRFDVRVPSREELRRGRGIKVLELNGLTAEATHIYDPAGTLLGAYRVLFEQWRIAFEIGRQNRARGVRPATLGELGRLLRRRKRARGGSAAASGQRPASSFGQLASARSM